MPGRTPARRSHRRRFLLKAGVTLATALGVTAVVLMPDPTWSAPAADAGPGAALITACDRFIQASAAYDADCSALEREDNPLWADLEAAEAAAQAIPARTFAGVVAKARVVVDLGTMPDGTLRMESSYTGKWPADIVRDVLRIAGIEVPA